jgi:hypothetical protein
MYAQCNKVAFESSMNPREVHLGFANGAEGKKVNLQDSKVSNDDEDEMEANDDEDDTQISPTKNDKKAEETLSEDDLLEELTDLF